MENLIEGKSYKLKIPNLGKTNIHIDYVLDSKCYENEKIIVFRYWIVKKQRWNQDVISLWELEMYNEK